MRLFSGSQVFHLLTRHLPQAQTGVRQHLAQDDVARGSLDMEQEQSIRVGRRLAAIVAADVAGYSRLMGLDEVDTTAQPSW